MYIWATDNICCVGFAHIEFGECVLVFQGFGITDHVIVFWWVYYRFSRKMLKLQNQCQTLDYLVLHK